MDIGSLVFSKEFGRGIIEKISPSNSLMEVRFKNFPNVVLLSTSLERI